MKYPEDKVFGSRGDFDSMPVVRQIYGEVRLTSILESNVEQ